MYKLFAHGLNWRVITTHGTNWIIATTYKSDTRYFTLHYIYYYT